MVHTNAGMHVVAAPARPEKKGYDSSLFGPEADQVGVTDAEPA